MNGYTFIFLSHFITLLHSKRPKLYGVLAILNAKGLIWRLFLGLYIGFLIKKNTTQLRSSLDSKSFTLGVHPSWEGQNENGRVASLQRTSILIERKYTCFRTMNMLWHEEFLKLRHSDFEKSFDLTVKERHIILGKWMSVYICCIESWLRRKHCCKLKSNIYSLVI